MFKLYIGILSVIFILISPTFAQQGLQDVVYLKNGSIIRGIIIEQVPNVSVKIQTKDGNVLIYKVEEIAKMTKERPIGYQNLSMRGEKSPAAAFLLSFLIPGVGQYYNGDIAKGIIQEALVGGGIALALAAGTHRYSELDYYYSRQFGYNYYNYYEETTAWFYVGLGVASAASLWSMIDAPLSANRINRERERAYGHLLEFNSDKQVLGFDLSSNSKMIGAKLSLHF